MFKKGFSRGGGTSFNAQSAAFQMDKLDEFFTLVNFNITVSFWRINLIQVGNYRLQLALASRPCFICRRTAFVGTYSTCCGSAGKSVIAHAKANQKPPTELKKKKKKR